jgi:hypothetical protein
VVVAAGDGGRRLHVQADAGDRLVVPVAGGQLLGRHPFLFEVEEREGDPDLVDGLGLVSGGGARGIVARDGLGDGPEGEDAGEGVHRVDLVGLDLHVDLAPRLPGRRQPLAVPELRLPVVVAARRGARAAEQHQPPVIRLVRVGFVDVAARDGQAKVPRRVR